MADTLRGDDSPCAAIQLIGQFNSTSTGLTTTKSWVELFVVFETDLTDRPDERLEGIVFRAAKHKLVL